VKTAIQGKSATIPMEPSLPSTLNEKRLNSHDAGDYFSSQEREIQVLLYFYTFRLFDM